MLVPSEADIAIDVDPKVQAEMAVLVLHTAVPSQALVTGTVVA